MLILLVEDDIALLEPLRAALMKVGHTVDAMEDGETAQWYAFEKDYDLLILDWMLPKISGLEVCRSYRLAGKVTPILMLTAKDGVSDKVMGLDAGADDYLVKPVDIIELLARVRALGRRSLVWQGDILNLGDLRLNLSNFTIELDSQTIQLSSREFQLMEYLMRHPRQVLTHTQIEQALWSWGEEPESNALTTLVRRLRQKLQIIGARDCLETVHRLGYRLQAKS